VVDKLEVWQWQKDTAFVLTKVILHAGVLENELAHAGVNLVEQKSLDAWKFSLRQYRSDLELFDHPTLIKLLIDKYARIENQQYPPDYRRRLEQIESFHESCNSAEDFCNHCGRTVGDSGDINSIEKLDVNFFLRSMLFLSVKHLSWTLNHAPSIRQAIRIGDIAPTLKELQRANSAAKDCVTRMGGTLPRFISNTYKIWLQQNYKAINELLAHNESTLATILNGVPELLTRSLDQSLDSSLRKLESIDGFSSERELRVSFSRYFSLVSSHLRSDVQADWCDKWLAAIANAHADSVANGSNDVIVNCVLIVLDAWDQLSGTMALPEIVWAETQSWIDQLFSSSDRRLMLQRSSGTVGDFIQIDVGPDQAERVKETGLICTNRKEGSTSVLKKAVVIKPIVMPSVYHRICDIAALDGERLSEPRTQALELLALFQRSSGGENLKEWLEKLSDSEQKRSKYLIENLAQIALLITESLNPSVSDFVRLAFSRFRKCIESEGVIVRPATAEEMRAQTLVRWTQSLPGAEWRTVSTGWFNQPPGQSAVLLMNAGNPNSISSTVFRLWDKIEVLRSEDIEWTGWEDIKRASRHSVDLAGERSEEGAKDSERELAWDFFLRLYARSEAFSDHRFKAYRELASKFYVQFTELGGKSFPVWDVELNGPKAITAEDLRAEANVRWVRSELAVGTVVKVGVWGRNGSPAALDISCGNLESEGIFELINLPPPHFAGQEPFLRKFYEKVLLAPFSREPKDHTRSCLKALQSDFSTNGSEWFNRWAYEIYLGKANADSSAWFGAITRLVKCYPSIDTKTTQLLWPDRGSTKSTSITFVHDTSPVYTVLSNPEDSSLFFSVKPETSRVRLSLGCDLKSNLALADAAVGFASQGISSDKSSVSWKIIDKLLEIREASRPEFLNGQESTNSTIRLFTQLFPLLVESAGDGHPHLPAIVDASIAAAESLGLRVTPSSWDFSQAASWDRSWSEPKCEFSETFPAGVISLEAFGLKTNDQSLCKCNAKCSVGLPPKGLLEIREGLNRIKELGGDVGSLEEFLDRLPFLIWESTEAKRSMDHAHVESSKGLLADMVRAHLEYWGRIRPRILGLAGIKAGPLDHALSILMEEFGLSTYPGNQEFMSDFNADFERWFNYAEGGVSLSNSSIKQGGRLRRGRIAEVLLPGVYRRGEESPRVLAKVHLLATESRNATN
jgi:hypothetical protein